MEELDLGQTIRGFRVGQKVFRRYTLVRILGRGGMGVVWLARDEELEQDVALKFLPDLVVHDLAVLDELKRETRRSLQLTHHNIVRIHDFVQDAESACISMEYIDGPTLSALRVEQPNRIFEPETLLPWVEQICGALEYAHHHARIVHRDIKPANLMLNGRGELKVADFGIARSLSNSVSMLTMARGTSGTLAYMSPQQLDGERASNLDDIYSLGATLYELLTSKPPFYSGEIESQLREKVPVSIAARRRELGIQTKDVVPSGWEQRIADCLAKDPAKRPQSAKELAVRLGLVQRSALVPNISLQPRFWLPWRRRAAVGLSILSVFGVVALFTMGPKTMLSLVADVLNREPTAEWARTVPLENMTAVFGKGALLRFEPQDVGILRESTGVAHVIVKGSAITRGALYESVTNDDSAVLPEWKLAEWRKARERASFLRERAGSDVAAVEEKAFQFVRETTAAGKTIEFQFQFKARREGNDWRVDRVIAADLTPTEAMRSRAITYFSSPAILGTDKATRDKKLLSEAIDNYIADVSKANAQAIKRFAKDGRDPDGNPLFPAEAMAGERFAQTRMRILQSNEVQNWTDDDLQYAINEAFARHGRLFEDQKIAALFNKLSWYRPQRLSNQQIEESLSDVEVQNILMLHSVTVARKESAERAKKTIITQRNQEEQARAQQEAMQAQREAEARAQRETAAAAIVGGLMNAIINRRR